MTSTVKVKKLLMQRSTLYKDVSADVVEELLRMGDKFGMDVKKVVSAFDKFMTVSRQDNDSVSVDDVDAFGKEQEIIFSKSKANSVFSRQEWDDVDVSTKHIPSTKPASSTKMMERQRISPYLARSSPIAYDGVEKMEEDGSFECSQGETVQSVLHGDLSFIADQHRLSESHSVKTLSNGMERTYMMNGVGKRAEYLEDRIENFEHMLEDMCGGKLQPVASASQDVSVFCGRVCCDTEGGRLNAKSVMIEGSVAKSRGSRVKVDLSGCKRFRLFPGQIIGIIGTNPSGFCIVAQEVITSFPCSEYKEHASNSSLKMVVAAGPFTTTQNLIYQPLQYLLEYCAKTKPDTLLLLGPFVDEDHPQIKSGLVEHTFEDIFEAQVTHPLKKFVEDTAIKVIVIPSSRDVHHEAVVPQRPLLISDAVDSLPNPCTFSYKGITIGCSSADWLMSCTKEEISKAGPSDDRLSKLVGHMVEQRSYYPLYPSNDAVPLDISRGSGLEMVYTPSIMVSPSDLAPFAKVSSVPEAKVAFEEGSDPIQLGSFHHIVSINPGRLTKGKTAGTFAHIYVNPPKNEEGLASLSERCMVEIRKL